MKNICKNTEEYKNYERYRVVERHVEAALEAEELVTAKALYELTTLNPNYWKAFFLAGKYYYEHQFYVEAHQQFEKAASLVIPSVPERAAVLKYLRKTIRKIS